MSEGPPAEVRPYRDEDVEAVCRLWADVFPDDPPRNEPGRLLATKLLAQREHVLVAERDGRIVGAMMAGFDGVRGWLHHVAVLPEFRRRGVAAELVREAERRLAASGCPKVNLQVRATNRDVLSFYRSLGYEEEERASLGKVLEPAPRSAEDASPARDAEVTLREITEETLYPVLKLDVTPAQKSFVAPNSVSLAEAGIHADAWARAIYAGDTPVGFLMLSDQPAKPLYYLWRFMVDARYQRLGFGRKAMELLIEHVKGRPSASELKLSFVEAAGGPGPFYESLGFRKTGEYHDGEAIMILPLETS